MKKVVSGILFTVLAVGIIWLSIWYNQKSEEEARQAQAIADSAVAQAQQRLMENLKITNLVVGTGAEAKNGETVTVNYVGTLMNGTKFDSSYDRKQPFSFLLGAGQVIKGWDYGVLGMKVGGKRELTIPPELAYGAAGAGSVIPANATLHFVVELLSVSTSAAGQ